MRNTLILLFLTLAAAGSISQLQAATAARPNIVFILADDLGWTDTAVYGSGYYETPNIDGLARQGMRFTNYHSCQNCQPARAALMTGQYGARTGVYTVGGIDRFDWQSRPLRPVDNVTKLPLEKVTIAQSLKAAGYATAMFGKWHLGEDGAYHPHERGFDEAIASAGRHFDFKTAPQTDYPKGQYLADFLTDKATDFIRRHKDGPFFLYLPHFGVHSPYQAKPGLIARFKTRATAGGHHDPTYAAMIASVDESIGRIVQLLDELKIADNTVVIFSSDNGGVGGYGRPDGLIREEAVAKKTGGPHKESVTDNAPLRSGKGSLYEGGIRVPFIVRWPGATPPGAITGTPAIHVDLFPTLLEIAGVAAPPRQPLDGESLVPLLRDPARAMKRDAIYSHFPGYLGKGKGEWRTTPVSVVQAGNWKLMEYLEDGHLELYNLDDDLGETRDLARTMPEKAGELHTRLTEWRTAVKAPMPTKNIGKEPAGNKTGKKKNREAE